MVMLKGIEDGITEERVSFYTLIVPDIDQPRSRTSYLISIYLPISPDELRTVFLSRVASGCSSAMVRRVWFPNAIFVLMEHVGNKATFRVRYQLIFP